MYIMRRKRAHISLGVQQLLQELRKNNQAFDPIPRL